MQNNKRCFVLIAGYFLFGAINANAQADSAARGNYSMIMYTGGGISHYSSQSGIPDYFETSLLRNGGVATFRILWHPDHRLRAGVETGWTTFYSYTLENTNTPGKLSLTAIPLLAVFSMPIISRLYVYGGAGIYFLTSKLEYAGTVKSHDRALGWMGAISYNHQVSRVLSASLEVKWLDASETQNAALSAQLMLAWKFLEW
jgi:hypothetical protein